MKKNVNKIIQKVAFNLKVSFLNDQKVRNHLFMKNKKD